MIGGEGRKKKGNDNSNKDDDIIKIKTLYKILKNNNNKEKERTSVPGNVVVGGSRCSSRRSMMKKRRFPSRGCEQTKILPPKFQSPIVFYKRIPIGREHSEEESGLSCSISGEGNAFKPRLLQLFSPVLELHFAAPRRPSDCEDISDLP